MILKFINTSSDCQVVIECHNYHVGSSVNHKEVTVYSGYTSENGVTYRIGDSGNDRPFFDVCFVENSEGKTIDKIK